MRFLKVSLLIILLLTIVSKGEIISETINIDDNNSENNIQNLTETSTKSIITSNDEIISEPIDIDDYDSENTTNNLTETSTKSTNFKCNTKNFTDGEQNIVKLVNGSTLASILTSSSNDDCFVVMFYLPWCRYSANLAPSYNALPRAFKFLDIYAMDLVNSSGTKFGASAVPLVLIFQHTNVLARFNHTQKNITDLVDFVTKNTGLEGNRTIEIEPQDLEGPIPTVAQKRFDYFLFFCWAFLIFGLLKYLVNKFNLTSLVKRFLSNRQDHQHRD